MRLVKNITLLVIATAMALLLAEGGLRLAEPAQNGAFLQTVQTEIGPYTVLIPDARGTLAGRPVSVNHLGYRGRPDSPGRNPSTFRIQVFGDSHTFGVGARDNASYPAIMESRLNRRQDQYEILNFGVPGYDFSSIEKHIELNAPKYDPDLVIWTFHAGDIVESDIIVNKRTVRGMSWGLRFRNALISHSDVMQLIVLYGSPMLRAVFGNISGTTVSEIAEVKGDGLRWQAFEAAVLHLQDELSRRCSRLAVVLFPSMIDFQRTPDAQLYSLVESWLRANKVPVFNLLPAFRGRKAPEFWATLLDHHPNEKAYAIAGDAVADYIEAAFPASAQKPNAACPEGDNR